MTTAHIQIAGIPLAVEYLLVCDKFATVSSVRQEGANGNIYSLLAPDVINGIRVACVKHARAEATYIARRIEEERLEP